MKIRASLQVPDLTPKSAVALVEFIEISDSEIENLDEQDLDFLIWDKVYQWARNQINVKWEKVD